MRSHRGSSRLFHIVSTFLLLCIAECGYIGRSGRLWRSAQRGPLSTGAVLCVIVWRSDMQCGVYSSKYGKAAARCWPHNAIHMYISLHSAAACPFSTSLHPDTLPQLTARIGCLYCYGIAEDVACDWVVCTCGLRDVAAKYMYRTSAHSACHCGSTPCPSPTAMPLDS